jgi:alpha-glucosidase (family GH31 glycosyl hydrolase)
MQKINMLNNEYWYGGAVNDGYVFPVSFEHEYTLDLSFNDTYNQVNPIYFSSKGRYIWLDGCSIVSFSKGVISIDGEYELCETAGGSLKSACLDAAFKYYRPNGRIPNEISIRNPQYCTWIDMMYEPNQDGVLKYAHTLIEKGYKPGIFIIDDCWHEDYGVWDFNRRRFPDPVKTINELHSLGFKVILWICPYISPDSAEFRKLREANALLLNEDGSIKFADWWNGFSAVLDFTTVAANEWLTKATNNLKEKYGVDGFKLDAGDGQYLGRDFKQGNLQNELWASSIESDLKELRACYRLGGQDIIHRLADKAHMWNVTFIEDEKLAIGGFLKYGMNSILPNILTQGLTGYYYGCPDMVGGGLFTCFMDEKKLDYELIIRSCQVSALLPMIQFSYAVWNVEELNVHCKKMLNLREDFIDYIIELAHNASKTGEPIVRYMEYEFPNQGMEKVTNQFMLGERFLVAPADTKGSRSRTVVFPNGKWIDIDNKNEYSGGAFEIDCPLDKLPVFQKSF